MTDDSQNPGSDTTIERRPYLGDPKVLDKILRTIAREGVNCRIAVGQGILSTEDANLIDEKETRNAAAILLGRNRQYAVDTNWNVPGVIDAFVATELSIEAKGSEDILVAGLNKFLREIHERLETVNLRQLDADWEKRIEDIFVKYRSIYLGLSVAGAVDPAPAAFTKAVPEEPVAPSAPPTPVTPTAPKVPVPATVAPISKAAPQEPAPRPQPAVAPAPSQEPRRGVAAWKPAAAAIVLLLLISGGVLLLRKPAPAPAPTAQVTAPTPPPPPKPVAAATALLHDGKILLLTENGETLKTVSAKEGSILRLFDQHLEAGQERFLIAKAVKQPSKEQPVGADLWLLDGDGQERLVNNSVMHARLSPDGSKVAYSTTTATLEIQDLTGARLAELPGVYEPIWRTETQVAFLLVPEGRTIWPPEALAIATFDLTTKTASVVTGGRFDDMTLECHPLQKWLLLTAGADSGLPSFWKVSATGSEPAQITNVRLNESGDKWVPTPFATCVWSKDGRWFVYDFKDGQIEQTWGLEFDEKGDLKRALHLADGLYPHVLGNGSFICMKRKGDSFEMITQKLP